MVAKDGDSLISRRGIIRRGVGLAGGVVAAGALAACGSNAASPTAPSAAAAPTAAAPTAAQQSQSAPNPTPAASTGLKKIRVLTADFFYDAMIVPATASFNNQRQGDVYVTVEKEPDGWVTKVIQQVRDKNVIWSAYAVDSFFNLYQRIATGMIQPLDDYIASSKVDWAKNWENDLVNPVIHDAGTYKGKFYVFPTKLNMCMVCYNTSMVQGVGYQTIPKTWDEIRVMLSKIKTKYADQNVMPTSINMDLWRAVGGIFSTFTDKPYQTDGPLAGMVDIDSQAWFDALDLMKSFYTDKLADPSVLNSPDEQTVWQKGKMAVQFNYPSWLHLAQTAWGQAAYNASNMPGPKSGGPPRTWMHVDGTYLFQNAPYPQETVDWILSILGPRGPAADSYTAGELSRSGSPIYKTYVESKLVKNSTDNPWLYGTYQMAANSTAAPLSPLHFLLDQKNKKYLPAFFRGEMTAKDAMTKIKNEVMADKDKMLSGES
jgi:maltose-binding protein MalE